MTHQPLVSVIIPTYNRRDKVVRAVKSVTEQTYNNIEIIVVDGPSSDGTKKAIQELDNTSLTYIRSEKKKGSSWARNKGVEVSSGDFVAFLDSDDVWLPGKLDKQIDIISKDNNDDIAAVYCSYYRQFDDLNCISEPNHELESGKIFEKLLSGWFPIITSVVIIRKEVFTDIGGFDEELPYFEDYDLMLNISEIYEIKACPQPLMIKHVGHSDALSRDNKKKITGLAMFIDRWQNQMYQELGPDAVSDFTRDRLSRYYFWRSVSPIQNKNRKLALRYFYEYIIKSPRIKIKHLIFFFLSIMFGPSTQNKLLNLYRMKLYCKY